MWENGVGHESSSPTDRVTISTAPTCPGAVLRQAVPLQGAWILSHCAFPYSLWRQKIPVPLRRTSIGGNMGQALQSRLPQAHCSPTRAAQLLDQSTNKEPCNCLHRHRVTCQDSLTTSGGTIICADMSSEQGQPFQANNAFGSLFALRTDYFFSISTTRFR